jgi:uncharacterized damage-inducible protein DinB
MTEDTNSPAAILSRYLSAPTSLQAAVASLTDDQLNRAGSTGSWTIRQIVHHIVDGDDLWTIAIKAALGNSQTPFGLQWYWQVEQADWAEHWNYASRPIEPSLALFAANRRHVEQLIQHVSDAWQRSMLIQWPASQEKVSVGDIVGMQTRHARDHIDEIQAIRHSQGF